MFQEVAYTIIKHCQAIEKKRCALFRLTHPSREEYTGTDGPPINQSKKVALAPPPRRPGALVLATGCMRMARRVAPG